MMFLLSIEYEVYTVDGYGKNDTDGNWNGLVGQIVNRLSQKIVTT